jgi:hypothetical protein
MVAAPSIDDRLAGTSRLAFSYPAFHVETLDLL